MPAIGADHFVEEVKSMHAHTRPDALRNSIARRVGLLTHDNSKREAPPDGKSDEANLDAFRQASSKSISTLTQRQKQVLDLLVVGSPSKNIAFDLGISQRTVENHRAAIALRTRTKSLPALVHTAVCGRCSLNKKGAGVVAAEIELLEANARSARLAQEIETMRINLDEIQHRMKNMVAIIHSISHQTMRLATTKSDFDEKFSTRLSAFCRSLDLLVGNDWSGVGIHELARAQLATFGALDKTQISIEGAELTLTPEAAHTIGLALHELATNAIKYGSLTVSSGRVAVKWEIEQGDLPQRFRMSWRESGGPLVAEPKRQGFGRRLIQQLAALDLAGRTTHEFLPKGVVWTLDIPASSAVVQREDTAKLTVLA
jgi:two-component sensor histidine kinase